MAHLYESSPLLRRRLLCAVLPLFLSFLTFLLSARPAVAQENSDCLACHEDRTLTGERKGRSFSVYVDERRIAGSVHASISCVSCHSALDGKDLPHEPGVPPVDCGSCHDTEKMQHARSLHGQAAARGDPLAPRCVSCHGYHDILSTKDPRSPTYPMQIPFLCGRCHREGTAVMEQRPIHQDHILENFSESIHGEGLLKKGLIVAPNCTSCHTAHLILPHTEADSSISRGNIARTCTRCHTMIEAVHRKIIRGELWEKEAHVLPACIDCHQPHKIRRVFYTQGMADQDCLRCHARRDLKASSDGRSLFVLVDALKDSKHAKVACSQCHSEVSVSSLRPCETIKNKVDCTACHEEVGQQYVASVHGRLKARNDANSPDCKECHGSHGVLGRLDPRSATFSINVPQLCARCHREGQKAALRYSGPQHEIVEHYRESIHGKGLTKSGLTVTAMCTSCHTAHQVLPAKDPRSSVNRENIPATCGNCHHGIEEQFEQSVHSELVTKTDKPLPICSDCHTAHTISRTDAEGFKLGIMKQCGRCHEKIAETYFDTYHGKVTQLGYTKTAKCYDCHGAHDILRVTDPRSHLSRENVVATCRKCHPGATRRFAGYLTHATHHDPRKYPYLFWTFWGMTSLLIGTFVIGGIHTLLWLPRAFQMRREMKAKRQKDAAGGIEEQEQTKPEDNEQSSPDNGTN
jgi:hypothetical protein